MKTISILVGAMLGMLATGFGQSQKQRSLAIEYGYQHFARQDQLFSPLIYNGNAPLNLGLNYTVNGKASHQQAYLSFGLYNMSSHESYDFTENFDELEERTLNPSSFQVIRLGYGYARKFGQNDRWHAGARLDGQIEALFYEMGFASIFGYTTAFSLAPTFGGDFALSKKTRLSAQVAAPLVGWVSRSPYALNDDDYIDRQSSHNNLTTILNLIGDGELRSLDSYRQLDLDIRARQSLSDKMALTLGWRARWYEITEPKRVLALQNGFNIGLQLGL